MTPRIASLRAGVTRGRIELSHAYTNPQEVFQYLFWPVIFFVVMLFMRGSTVPGTEFSLAASVLPSVIGMNIAFGMMGVAGVLATEREDGTLLRAKAVPNGMPAYLIAKIIVVTGMTAASVALILVGGLVLFGRDLNPGVGGWFTLVWVFALGMVAVLPIGAAIGSLLTNPRSMSLLFLPLGGLISISGIFYPITSLQGWIQGIAQVFPVYWLGLGMRSALLPGDLVTVEIGESWRHLETAGVLGAWAVLGLLLAPPLLRRMARRESGSAVEARRASAMRRVS
ncbi:ABC transporter permease [Halostreptopolyspora alba]|uniref:ABC transporter permease n=1 Tax=Halostreptopolyspora alba TaxID=2487137 RepID=A0A3N0EGA9_9ACTN|nr:ABC transporter permease [Nocardiopsaceae bacterium YIM 96095]